MNVFHLRSFPWWPVASSVFRKLIFSWVKQPGFGFLPDLCEVRCPRLHFRPPRGPAIRPRRCGLAPDQPGCFWQHPQEKGWDKQLEGTL